MSILKFMAPALQVSARWIGAADGPAEMDAPLRVLCAANLNWWLICEALPKSAPDAWPALEPAAASVAKENLLHYASALTAETVTHLARRVFELTLPEDDASLAAGAAAPPSRACTRSSTCASMRSTSFTSCLRCTRGPRSGPAAATSCAAGAAKAPLDPNA